MKRILIIALMAVLVVTFTGTVNAALIRPNLPGVENEFVQMVKADRSYDQVFTETGQDIVGYFPRVNYTDTVLVMWYNVDTMQTVKEEYVGPQKGLMSYGINRIVSVPANMSLYDMQPININATVNVPMNTLIDGYGDYSPFWQREVQQCYPELGTSHEWDGPYRLQEGMGVVLTWSAPPSFLIYRLSEKLAVINQETQDHFRLFYMAYSFRSRTDGLVEAWVRDVNIDTGGGFYNTSHLYTFPGNWNTSNYHPYVWGLLLLQRSKNGVMIHIGGENNEHVLCKFRMSVFSMDEILLYGWDLNPWGGDKGPVITLAVDTNQGVGPS
ncbi:MAG: hypothetical protein ABIE68_03975 [bacterium]